MRHLTAISITLFASLLCQSAWAQECTSDTECPDGYACEPAGDLAGVPACDGPDCADQTACIRREGPCTTDADCPADSVCEEVGGGGVCPAACAPGEECPEPEPCVIDIMTDCVRAPLTCTSDDECPSPLYCVEHQIEQDCTVALGDTTPCEPVVETSKLCTYVIADCTTNADCAEGYECATMPGGESCTVSVAACPAGEECPPPTEVCETEPDWNMCFPAHVPCATDADCADDWVCYDFVEEGALPPWWESDGNTRACLPSGIVAVIEGQAEFEDQGVQRSADAAEAGSGSSEDSPDVDASKGSGDSAGCSTSSWPRKGGGIVGLLMLVLAVGCRVRWRPSHNRSRRSGSIRQAPR